MKLTMYANHSCLWISIDIGIFLIYTYIAYSGIWIAYNVHYMISTQKDI